MSSEFQDAYDAWLGDEKEQVQNELFERDLASLNLQKPVILSPNDTLKHAIDLMNLNKIGSILVEDKGRVCGILTERDILMKVVSSTLNIEEVPLQAVMTHEPDVLGKDAVIAHALRTMAVEGYRHIPVVDEQGKGLAVVSMRQIVQFLVELFPREVLNAMPEGQSYPSRAEGG